MAQAGTSDASGLYGASAGEPCTERATTFMMRMASRGRAVRKPKLTAAEKPEAPREDQVEALTEALSP